MPAKSKKIAIFVDGEFIPSFSGATDRFHYLSRALQKFTDTEVIIVLCDRGWSDIEEIKKEEFKTYLVHPTLFRDVTFLTKLLKNQDVNLVQFANLELAVEVGIPLAMNLSVHLIFEAHYGDVEFAKAVGTPRKTLEHIVQTQNRFGKYFDKVIALSGDDIELAKNFRIPKGEVAIIPSGVNPEDFPTNCFNGSSRKIIFMGNLFFDTNLIAVRKIKQTIYKRLKYKGYSFRIIGDITRDEQRKLSDKNFIITGKKQNLADAFEGSMLALAPISNGPGMRIKIVNYLNAGIPVITTNQGARGFPRKDLLIIEDDFKKYPALIEKIVGESSELKSLSVSGRRFVREYMSWKIMADAVSREYKKILKKPVVPKARGVCEVAKFSFGEPAWIREVIVKKRFKRNVPFVGRGKYIIAGRNKKPLIVALEGLPCAGKSTFWHKFQKKNKGFLCIPELYIKSEKSSLIMRREYANAEIIKYQSIPPQNTNSILMDRSFLSTLAFSYAKYKTFGDADDYLFNKNFFKKNKKSIIFPNLVFVFTITEEESIRRRIGLVRDDNLNFWEDKQFLKNFSLFYRSSFFRKLIDARSVIFIDTAKMNKKEIYKQISRQIGGSLFDHDSCYDTGFFGD